MKSGMMIRLQLREPLMFIFITSDVFSVNGLYNLKREWDTKLIPR
jgi:hypothetical protein